MITKRPVYKILVARICAGIGEKLRILRPHLEWNISETMRLAPIGAAEKKTVRYEGSVTSAVCGVITSASS
jgi:hypothetical protein